MVPFDRSHITSYSTSKAYLMDTIWLLGDLASRIPWAGRHDVVRSISRSFCAPALRCLLRSDTSLVASRRSFVWRPGIAKCFCTVRPTFCLHCNYWRICQWKTCENPFKVEFELKSYALCHWWHCRCRVYGYSSSQSNFPHRYGNSHAIWDHTVLPATRQRWHYRPYPSQSWYSIKRP